LLPSPKDRRQEPRPTRTLCSSPSTATRGQAKAWLELATKWLAEYPEGIPVREDLATGLHLRNWLEAQVLRHEAEALLLPRK
jgi:hypothetical protein